MKDNLYTNKVNRNQLARPNGKIRRGLQSSFVQVTYDIAGPALQAIAVFEDVVIQQTLHYVA